MNLLFLLLPAVLIALAMKLALKRTITAQEMLAQIVAVSIVVAVVYQIGKHSQMADTQILNGQVTGKERDRVSCSHSYSCNCRTVTSGSGNNRTTSTVCDTCYEHSWDYDWNVATTVGGLTIDRVDRQGEDEPQRWTRVRIGDPVAREESYKNYVKGAPDSLFSMAALEARYTDKIPAYPRIYDYHYADRVIAQGVTVPDLALWNALLANSLKRLGPSKQANVVVVISGERNGAYGDALRTAWLGGKKNDIVVAVGAPDYPKVAWARVFSWSRADLVNVALRNEILDAGELSPRSTIALIERAVARDYVRRPMQDFAYLEDAIEPPTWVMVLAFLVATAGSLALGLYFHRNDIVER